MSNSPFSAYYRRDLENLYSFVTERGARVVRIRSERKNLQGKYAYIIIDNAIGNIKDVQLFFKKLKSNCNSSTRLIVTYYNHLWEPVLKLATFMGLRSSTPEQNWLDSEDITNLLKLSGFEVITRQRRLLLPLDIPLITPFMNRIVANLPIINNLCLTTYVIARLQSYKKSRHSVSIVVPARNESGNIPNIVKSIPKFGKSQEIIFVEGGSEDKTWVKIKEELKKERRKNLRVKAYKQRGRGKASAVRLGFQKSTGDILMIYDADMTVNPKDLKKFYEVLSGGMGEFANGSRLVYPLEKDAMQTLNKFFNKIFSLIFTWILGQRFKDTLCGTKALFNKDYQKIKRLTGFVGKDPFGDFDLIFGAVKLNLKVIEIPVAYRNRIYGKTNINRFRNGLQLTGMIYKSFIKFKFLQQ